MSGFAYDNPDDALAALLGALEPVGVERIGWAEAPGRVLAEPVTADRDSPAHDVSAMDGYAVRTEDLEGRELPVAGEVPIGTEPPQMPVGAAMRLFTGACVPPGADAVIRREDTEEHPDRIRLLIDPATIEPGLAIRRCGENLRSGDTAVGAGLAINAAVMGAMASFGAVEVAVRRSVRVSALVTGDELNPIDSTPTTWQIRDSNGPALAAAFANRPWVSWGGSEAVRDDRRVLVDALAARLDTSDVVLLTGGVSMGDYDYVPDAVEAVGGRVVFHKLPIRPGKPILAAVGPGGQAILGLPGNPLSVVCGVLRFALPACRRRAGLREPGRPRVRIDGGDGRTIPLWWYRPAERIDDDRVRLIGSKGSGDIASAARGDGLVEVPPNAASMDALRFFAWDEP